MRFLHTCFFVVLTIFIGLLFWLILSMAVGALLVATADPAYPHDAPAGWSYPYSCCTNHDCRMVPQAAVGEGPDGYTIRATDELVPYQDTRVRQSPDGDFHWCSVAGKDNTRTICLFVPPRAF